LRAGGSGKAQIGAELAAVHGSWIVPIEKDVDENVALRAKLVVN